MAWCLCRGTLLLYLYCSLLVLLISLYAFYWYPKEIVLYLGSIIRCMRRLEEILRQLCQAAKNIGNTDLENKFSEGIKVIKRDIVFAASLYLWFFAVSSASSGYAFNKFINSTGHVAGMEVMISARKLILPYQIGMKYKFNVMFSKKVGIVFDKYEEKFWLERKWRLNKGHFNITLWYQEYCVYLFRK